MSSEPQPNKTRRFFPTGKFVTEEERDIVVQLFGLAHTHPEVDSESRKMLNQYLQHLGEKYDHDWNKMSVAPNGELQYFEDVSKTEN